jgi:cAMP response element-binding protein
VKSVLLVNTTKPNSVIHQAIQVRSSNFRRHSIIDFLLFAPKTNLTLKINLDVVIFLQIKPEPNIGGGHGMMNDSDLESDDSEDDSPKRRRDLTRRPSYRKILNDLGGGEMGG